MRPTVLALILTLSVATSAAGQAHKDIIRGRVTTDSGVAISNADVIVTMAPTVETVRQQTGADGRYGITVENGSGEYLLYVGAVGRKSFRARLTRVGNDTTFTVDVQLAAAVEKVAAVRVEATKDRPRPSFGRADEVLADGMNKTADGVFGALPPDMATNLDAMASLVPGLSTASGGMSAFGLSGGANATTLNGLAFAGGDLPRDVRTSTRFQTSPWDPTVGGFAGVRAARSLESGSNIASRTSHVTVDHPNLQVSDPVSARIGQEFSNLSVSMGGAGPYRLEELFYNYGVQVSRRHAPVAALNDLNSAALLLAGVSRDSAARLLSVLASQGVPLVASGMADGRTTTSVSFTERIDHALPDGPPGSIPAPTWNVIGYVSIAGTDHASISPTATLASTTGNRSAHVVLQGASTRYLGTDGTFANVLTSALSLSDARTEPSIVSPAGVVAATSILPDGSLGLGTLRFGGASSASRSRRWSWEVVNQTDVLYKGNKNVPLKLYVQSLLGGFDQASLGNGNGTFGYPNLQAVAANAPTGFFRQLSAPSSSGVSWLGAAAVGASYRRTRLFLTGGLRADANAFLSAPAFNADVLSTFGARTDHAPSSLALSPRLGFRWRIPGKGGFGMFTPLYQISTGETQLRGGFGRFRAVLPPTQLADAMNATGLSDASQSISCLGAATPTPDWTAYASSTTSVPRECVGGSSLVDVAPAVRLYDRGYQPLDSWRATLGVTREFFRTTFAIDGTYALNLHLPGSVDLNFAGGPRFSIDDEAGRPVFVSASSIVPNGGSVLPVEARRSARFGRVANRVSDLRGESRQLTVYAIPQLPYAVGFLTLGYSWTDARTQSRGFDASTAGDPARADWSRAAFTPRHQVKVQLARMFGRHFGVTTSFTAMSGVAFTPMVDGDINGDGLANDRAFLFNGGSNPAVAAALGSLLRSGPAATKECLTRQLGHVAAPNSCEGPWSATMNASVFVMPTLRGTHGRGRLNISVTNVLAGVDQALHGSARLRGWGMAPFPNAILYRVRSFDPVTKQFGYEVNPRFGSSAPSTVMQRVPFRVSLDVSLDLGRSYAAQRLEQNLRMRPKLVGTRAPADSIKKRYIQSEFSDFYGFLLTKTMSDSLALSMDQMRRFTDERVALRAKADSILGGLAIHLAGMSRSYDGEEALKRVKVATDDVWKAIYAESDFLQRTLTPGQLRLLPSPLLRMITNPTLKGRFFFGGY